MTGGLSETKGLRQRDAVIVATDVVGYSRLMGNDPRGTLDELDAVTAVLRGHVESRGGYIANIAGDATIAIFDTAVGATFAACAAQDELAARKTENSQMLLRIGVHQGLVFERKGSGVFGDAVNIAARLEGLAPAGGVAVSGVVHAASAASLGRGFLDQGKFKVKNIESPVHVYLVELDSNDDSAPVVLKDARPVLLGNLPARRSKLFSCSEQLRIIADSLETSRLVTLLGMGGLGKTTLAIEAGHQIAYRYPDGVWFADLGSVDTSSAVSASLAGIFGVTQQSGQTVDASLINALQGRHILLILDNCEHVTQAVSTIADRLLAACPRISILATSREVLSVAGEQIVQISPLDVSGDAASAVALFQHRAHGVSPDFDPRGAEEDIRLICQKLEGIPLAIELAAARCKSLTPQQIRNRLDQRFRLLTGGTSVSGRERHQTLYKAVQWSYDLLSEAEVDLLERASVFAGGFMLEAAEAVCVGGAVDAFDVPDILESLTSKSLLLTASTPSGMRYRMLETIRAFAFDSLEEKDAANDVHRAHAELFATQSCANFELWRSPDEAEAYSWLDLEINNLRNAFSWAKQNGEVDVAARIAASVGDIGRFRLIDEAAGWAEEIVAEARAAVHPRLIILLTWSASSAWAFSRFEDAERFGTEAISLLDDDRFVPFVWAYGDLAFVALYAGDVDKAVTLLQTGSAHPADARDRFIMAFQLYVMAVAGRADEARAIADDVVKEVDAAGVPMAMAIAHGARAAVLEEHDAATAIAEYEAGIELASTSGARFMEALLVPRLMAMRARSSDPYAALSGFEKMLMLVEKVSDIATFSTWHASLVSLFVKVGQYHAAATLHGTLSGLVDQGSTDPEHAKALRKAHEVLGAKTYSEATRIGAAMSLREATDYALRQIQIGLAAADPGSASSSG